jgi:hypothetical protein
LHKSLAFLFRLIQNYDLVLQHVSGIIFDVQILFDL